jgi:hypothetical protein
MGENQRGGASPRRPSDGGHGHSSQLARGTAVSDSSAVHTHSSSAVQRQQHVAGQTCQVWAGQRRQASGPCRLERGTARTRRCVPRCAVITATSITANNRDQRQTLRKFLRDLNGLKLLHPLSHVADYTKANQQCQHMHQVLRKLFTI